MTDRKRSKSSEELLREAKEGLAGRYESPSLPSDVAPEPPPLVRPADRITGRTDRSIPPPEPEVSRREASPETVRPRRVEDSTLPPSRLPSDVVVSGPTQGSTSSSAATVMRVFGILLLVIPALVWIGAIVAVVSDGDSIGGALGGAAFATIVPLAIAVFLFSQARRLKRDAEQARAGAPPSRAQRSSTRGYSTTERTPVSSGNGAGVAAYLESGEVVLGQATGPRPGSKAFTMPNWAVPAAVIGVVAAVFVGGFLVPLIIGAVVWRIVKNASTTQEASDDPAISTLVVTDRRVLGFSRKWWVSGPLSPWFSYPLDRVKHFSVLDDDTPTIVMTFEDDRTVSIVVSKQAAIEMASAARTAGI